MRLFAVLILVIALLLVLLCATGRLSWWDAGFPLLVAWFSLTNIAMYWLDRRADRD